MAPDFVVPLVAVARASISHLRLPMTIILRGPEEEAADVCIVINIQNLDGWLVIWAGASKSVRAFDANMFQLQRTQRCR